LKHRGKEEAEEIGTNKTYHGLTRMIADQERQKSKPQSTRRNTEEIKNSPLINADDTDQEEIGKSGNRKGKSSPRRRGDAEKTREREKALPQIAQMGADQERSGIRENKTFETQRKGGSGGARNLPLINADDTDQEEIGTSGNRKGKSSPRRRRDAEKTREREKALRRWAQMGADQERSGIRENKTFETQRKGGSGGTRNLPLINADDNDQERDCQNRRN
jgi:hypothetical protein